MRINLQVNIFLCLALVLLTSLAQAKTTNQSDSCSDILKNGTFSKSNYLENTYLQRILYTYFVSSNFSESKRNKVLGMDISVGESVMGSLDYSEAQFNAKKADVQRVTFDRLDQRKELEIALSSGDPAIVGAWSACMREKGGLILTARPLSSTLIEISLRYERGRFEQNIVKLEDNVSLSGGKITGGKSCLKKGKQLKYDSNGCVAYVSLKDEWEILAMSASDGRSSATAFVPARVEKRVVSTSYPFRANCEQKPSAQTIGGGPFNEEIRAEYDRRCPARLIATAFRTSVFPVFAVRLTQQQIDEGWRFKPNSGKVELQKIFRRSMNNCAEEYIRVEPFVTTYGYHAWGHSRGHDSKHGTACAIEPYVEMEREEWVAFDRKNSRPIRLPSMKAFY